MEMEIIEKVFTFENEGREINGVIALPKEEGKYPLVVMNHGFAGSKEEGIGFVSISKALAEKVLLQYDLIFRDVEHQLFLFLNLV